MAVLIDADSRILLQGPIAAEDTLAASGRAGAGLPSHRILHASQVVGRVDLDPADLAAGKLRISGVPSLASVPAFPTVAAAVAATGADASLVLAPAAAATEAALAAIDAGLGLVVLAGEALPEADRPRLRARLAQSRTRLIGPDRSGIVTPGALALGGARLGMPSSLTFAPGRVGILSHSADLAREAAWQTTQAGLGQSSVVSLARRQVAARAFADCLSLFVADEATEAIVLIVDPRERVEDEVAQLLHRGTRGKPVVALIMAAAVDSARVSGEARCREPGGVVCLEAEAAARQARLLARAGAIVAETPYAVGRSLLTALKGPAGGRRTFGAAWDFAAAVRAVERDTYGPELRLVEGGAPRISP